MSDLKNILNEEYKKKNSTIDVKTMMEMIEDIMNSDLTLISEYAVAAKEQPSMEDLYKYLPQFEFSEMMGRPDDAAIANKAEVSSTFTAMMRNIAPGEGLPAKIAAINEFVSAANPEDKDASEILRNLTFLRLLSVVVQDFTDAGAGFIFEAFLAGLLGGAQVSGRGGEETKGSLPIHDYVDDKGVPVSLKLLGPKTKIEGSMRNITQFLANHPLGIQHGIRYIVAIKYDDEKLGFYEFTITRDNFFEWLGSKVKLDRLVVPQSSQPIQEASEEEGAEPPSPLQQHADNFKELLISLMPMLGYPIEGEEDPETGEPATTARTVIDKVAGGGATKLTGAGGMGQLWRLWNSELMVSAEGQAAFNEFLKTINMAPPSDVWEDDKRLDANGNVILDADGNAETFVSDDKRFWRSILIGSDLSEEALKGVRDARYAFLHVKMNSLSEYQSSAVGENNFSSKLYSFTVSPRASSGIK